MPNLRDPDPGQKNTSADRNRYCDEIVIRWPTTLSLLLTGARWSCFRVAATQRITRRYRAALCGQSAEYTELPETPREYDFIFVAMVPTDTRQE